MSNIEVTNTRIGKTEAKDLNTAAMLVEARTKLADFMAASDVFLDTEGESLTADLEKEVKLEEIVKDSSIKIAGKKDGAGGKPDNGGKPDAGANPKTDTPGTKSPSNAAPITSSGGNINPVVLPEAQWAEDHVGLADGLKDGVEVEADELDRLKVGQVRNLLRANGIDLNHDKFGVVRAFVEDGITFKQAAIAAMHCAQVNVTGVQVRRYTNMSCQYSELVSRLHRLTTSVGEASVGVPGIFEVGGTYRTTRVNSTDKRVVREHKSQSHLIPKARVTFRQDQVSLSAEFVAAIENAVSAADAAPKLLRVLKDYGQWFGSEMLLGGRLDYWTDKKLEQTNTDEQDSSRFQFVTSARAAIDGVPVEGRTTWSSGLDEVKKQEVIEQAASLHQLMTGGNPAVVSPEKWVPTLRKYLSWKIVGFDRLVPTIAYLADEKLRFKCIKALRDCFTRNLQYRQTIKVGPTHSPPFGENVGDVKRIVQIEVNHGLNVDGLKVTYELMSGQRKEMPWAGERHGEYNDVVGPLDFDEEIASVETWTNDLLRRVAFKTTKGRRFPASPSEFYGRGTGGTMEHAEIEAPRVCGLVGNSGRIVDSIGLRYRELAAGQPVGDSRNFLILLEPYLFPINVPSQIEMTVRGVLVAGGWRTSDQLDTISADDKRNILIVELGEHSNQDGNYFWGLSDAALVQRAAVVLFLLKTGVRDRSWLKAHGCDEHREAVVQLIHNARDEPYETLRALSEGELVRWGFAIKGSTSAAAA